MENMEENCEMIWKIWKKAKFNSDKVGKIRKEGKLNNEKIGKWVVVVVVVVVVANFVRNVIIEINNVIMKIK
jgi:hypothetical protein